MANFDIALVLNQAAINTVAENIYAKEKDTLFKGIIDAEGLTVGWQVNSAPTINLQAPSAQLAKKIVWACDIARKYPDLIPHMQANPESMDMIAAVMAASDNLFTLTVQSFEVTFEGISPVTVPLIARCSVTSNGSSIAINLLSISITVEGSVNQSIVNKFVIPDMTQIIGNVLSGISIPQLSIPGLRLGATNVSIHGDQLIVFACLSTNPSSASLDGFVFPDCQFSALFSVGSLQQEVFNLMNGKTYGPSGSIDIGIGDLTYNATVSVQSPSASLNATDLAVTVGLSGSAGGSLKIGCVHPTIGFDVYAMPNPTITCPIVLNGSQVSIKATSVTLFAAIVNATGIAVVLEPFVATIGSAIASTVTSTVGPALVRDLSNGLSYTIPTMPINYQGMSVTVSGSNLGVNNIAGYLAIEGNINVA